MGHFLLFVQTLLRFMSYFCFRPTRTSKFAYQYTKRLQPMGTKRRWTPLRFCPSIPFTPSRYHPLSPRRCVNPNCATGLEFRAPANSQLSNDDWEVWESGDRFVSQKDLWWWRRIVWFLVLADWPIRLQLGAELFIATHSHYTHSVAVSAATWRR